MSLWWTPLLPFELFLCFGETESFDRLRVLWKLCLPEPRRRLLKAEQFMWFIVGNQKKRTKPEAPIRMVCWYSQKDLKNRFWGAAYIMNWPDSWRWGWRCWHFLIGMQLDGRKGRNARNHTRFATPTPMLIQNSLGASLTRTRCKDAWHGLVDTHIFC